jgi:hypothetical protein
MVINKKDGGYGGDYPIAPSVSNLGGTLAAYLRVPNVESSGYNLSIILLIERFSSLLSYFDKLSTSLRP